MTPEAEQASRELIVKLAPDLTIAYKAISDFGLKCFEMGIDFQREISSLKHPNDPSNKEL